jgi:glycosyltransferase involved in cell wall biosynthesis
MNASPRPRIAYYSIFDPLDKRSWSGIPYYMGKVLQCYVGDVHFLGPVKFPWVLDKTLRGMQKLSRLFFKREYIPKYSFLKNAYASYYLKKKMKGHTYDLLLAPAAASELGLLTTNIPVIYFGDATYKLYSAYYKKEFNNQGFLSRWEGEQLEKRALKKSDLVIFTSRWAAQSAIKDYGVSEKKVEIIQLGANIDEIPARENIFEKEKTQTLTLLFLSVDWHRKGGDIAFDTLVRLTDKGINAKLIVCGCVPPLQFTHPSMEVIPFLNKNEPQDLQHFVQIITSSHFLLLPTRADCTPVVNCEAGAYGMPAITTRTGGVGDMVIDGVNGYCLPMEAGGEAYANLIAEIFLDKKRYHQLIQSSRQRFDEELNWEKWAENFKRVLQQHHLYN